VAERDDGSNGCELTIDMKSGECVRNSRGGLYMERNSRKHSSASSLQMKISVLVNISVFIATPTKSFASTLAPSSTRSFTVATLPLSEASMSAVCLNYQENKTKKCKHEKQR